MSRCWPPSPLRLTRSTGGRARAPAGRDRRRRRVVADRVLPAAAGGRLLGILGRITVLRPAGEAAFTLPEKLMALRDRHAAQYDLDGLVGTQPAVQRLRAQRGWRRRTRVPVALVGEAGTGKHWLARAIHQAAPTARSTSPRSTAPACRRRRSKTCCSARAPPGCRSARSTSATRPACRATCRSGWPSRCVTTARTGRAFAGFTTDPHHEVKAGRLLEALHCRLTALTIPVPPLRERLADLAWWIDVLLARAAGAARTRRAPGRTRRRWRCCKRTRGPATSASWRACCSRAPGEGGAARRGRPAVSPPPPAAAGREKFSARPSARGGGAAADRRGAEVGAHDNRTKAAELLQIWRPRLLRRMEHFGLGGGEKDATEDTE